MRAATSSIILAGLLAVACSEKPCEETEHIPGQQATLSALTYNTGLGPGLVKYSSLRSPEVLSALEDEPFDILCIQEAWLQEDSDAITALYESQGLHVLRADTRGLNETGEVCEPGRLDAVLACVAQECTEEDDEDITLCALKKCRSQLETLVERDVDCAICAATSTGKPPDEIEEICTTTGSSRIHGGGNGVLLVSKFPLLNTETLNLPASFANRVAQMARIELPTGPVEVACTHISANQQLPPLQSEFDWWTAEKEAQVQIISDRLKERGGCMPQIFLGDLNTSRENGSLVGSSESVIELAECEGFDSPAATWSPPVCSSCAESTFKSDDSDSRLIDHVMVRTGTATTFSATAVERTLDWTVMIDDQGKLRETSLSDHFGIRVIFDISTK